MNDTTFGKVERLNSRKSIEMLFNADKSKSVVAYPIRAVYTMMPRTAGTAPAQLLMVVPKRKMHHAVDRNRVKRQLREAYRLHKAMLTDAIPAEQTLLMACLWLSESHLPSADIDRRMQRLMQQITEHLS